VIPAAGLGKRMFPVTKDVPKEMLPFRSKPMVHHAVEESIISGIREICIVIRKGKEIIKEYLLAEKGFSKKCALSFVYQDALLGLGDALLKAKDFVNGEPFLMVIPDQFLIHKYPPAKQIASLIGDNLTSIWSSMVKIPKREVTYFAGARGFEFERASRGVFKINKILSEKETRERYRSSRFEIRGFGRTIFPPEIFEFLTEEFINPKTKEVDLLKSFEYAMKEIPHFGVMLRGKPCDLGTFPGYYYYNYVNKE